MKHPHIELDYAFSIRPATLEDIDIFYQLVKVRYSEQFGLNTITKEELLAQWQAPGFEIERDTRLIFAPNGTLIGFSVFSENKEMPVRPQIWSYVHPDWRRLGVGTAIIEWAEARAKENLSKIPADARLILSITVYDNDVSAKELVEINGFTTQNGRVNMIIEFDAMPPAPKLPEGIRIITYPEFNNLREVYRVLSDAFRDHRGFVETDFETDFQIYQHFINSDPHIDYDTWFLAMDGDKLVGLSICIPNSWDDPHKGWVDDLGVLREYRGRGIAKALLHHSFGEFYKRGFKKMGLNADASNLTGAVQLYHNVGMRIFRRWHTYEKELRPGKEYTNQG
ncbi:MAG: GNAT family N-acetyltransferase [bacterium]|nr:GNAT family N-acetyltransferase [bacterium]